MKTFICVVAQPIKTTISPKTISNFNFEMLPSDSLKAHLQYYFTIILIVRARI